jgi:hypothetical protein
MGLRDVELREDNTYNSIQDNPAMTFFLPCFKEAVTYDRAVGYFRSSVFSLIGDGFEAIARKDGKIRIIASPHLDESDIEKINNGNRTVPTLVFADGTSMTNPSINKVKEHLGI